MKPLRLQKVFILESNNNIKLTFNGKSAIVTGAAGGMGLEISSKLSQNNIQVLMLDLRSPSKDFLINNINCSFQKVDTTIITPS